MYGSSGLWRSGRYGENGGYHAKEKMKQDIHPEYKTTKVTCACGNEWETRSTQDAIRLDVCSACHPFFTGQQKFINRGGRVEKFKNKYNLD